MKHRALIGIEISPDEIRAAYIRNVNGVPLLAGVGSVPAPSGGIDSEGLLGSHEIGDAIRRLCGQLDPKTSQVVVGMTVGNLVARVMEIPPVPDSDVRAVLRGEMDHYRILPAGQSAFDYYHLPEQPGKEKPVAAEGVEPVMRVLLMGAEERLVASYRASVDFANMQLVAVEPGAIAVMRALQPVLRVERSVATVIVGAAGTDVFITQEGTLQFYRRIDTGIPELRAQAGLTEARAVAGGSAQVRGPLLGAEEEVPVLEPAVSAPAAVSDPYNRNAISLLMTEVQRSLDYFSREFPLGDDSMAVRFALDAADGPEMFVVMQQYLRSDAEMASALTHIGVSDEARLKMTDTQGYRYTVSVGLALRGMDGEFADAPELDLGVGDRVIAERRIAPKTLVASAAAAAVIFAGTIAAALVIGNRTAHFNQQLAQENHELKSLTAEHAAKVAALNRQKDLVTQIHGRDKPMRETIEFLSAAVSRNACLSTLTVDAAGKIYLAGEAANSKVVADIMDTINLAPALEPIRLNNIMRVDPDKGGKTFRFDMQTGLTAPMMQAALPQAVAPADQPKAAKGGS
jgi:Tfp pilus assembly PilM family ATPase